MDPTGTKSMGFYGNLTLNVDKKTGKMTGASDVFSGAAEQAYQAKLKLAEPIEANKKNVNLQLEALSNLQAKANDLNTLSNALFYKDAIGNFGIFSNMVAASSSTSTTPADSIIDINLEAGSALDEFSVEVMRLAAHDSISSAVGLPSPVTVLNWSGPLTVGSQLFTLTETMSLTDVKNLINTKSADTKINASIIKVGATDYRLSLQSKDFATPITIVNGLTGTSVGQIPATSTKTIEDLSAQIQFNGITMTRPSNTINDIVDGLTLTLKKAEPGTQISMQITPDVKNTKDVISAWATSMNQIVDEIAKHRKFDSVTLKFSDDAVLGKADILQTVDALIKDNMTWKIAGAKTGEFKFLDQIGLTADFTGKITIDEQKLDEALKTNYDGVRKLFEYQETISNPKLLVSAHPNNISATLIEDSTGAQLTTTVTLNKDMGGALTATISVAGKTYTVPSNKMTVDGGIISFNGADACGTSLTDNPYKGFEYFYVGEIPNGGSDSSTIKFSQGFGDRLGRNLSSLLADKTGAFAVQKANFTNEITKIDERIKVINEKAESIKEETLQKFGKIEGVMQSMTATLAYLDAMMGNKK